MLRRVSTSLAQTFLISGFSSKSSIPAVIVLISLSWIKCIADPRQVIIAWTRLVE